MKIPANVYTINDLKKKFPNLKFYFFMRLRFVTEVLVNIDYFMVVECVRFLFTSCEESQTNEWAQRNRHSK